MKANSSFALSLALLPVCSFAQSRPGLNLTAITQAKVVTGTGEVLEGATVLTKDGIIVQVGKDVKIPAGTQVVDGKGLVVYPGFIEPGLTKGLKKGEAPDWSQQPNIALEPQTNMRTAHPLVHPEWNASEHIDLKDGSWSSLRKAGFTTAALVPTEGIFRGSIAVMNLGPGQLRNNLVVQKAGQALSLEGQRGGYPGTPLGAFATVRQSFLDAQQYASWPQNGPRPPQEAAHQPLLEILNKRQQLLLETDEGWLIDRYLDLAQEFRFTPVLLGCKQAFMAVQKLAQSKPRLIVGLDYAVEPKPATEKPEKATSTDPASNASKAAPDPNAAPDAKVNELQRLYLKSLTNPIQLTKAGIPFALTTRGSEGYGSFFEKLRRLNKEGWDEATILRSLTLEPARIYGLETRLGTIEAGKIANLTILSANFLDEKAKAKFLFIDGKVINLEKGDVSFSAPSQEDFEKE